MKQLNIDLQQVLDAISRRTNLLARLKSNEERFEEYERSLEGLQTTLDRERKDVAKLEGRSVKALYVSIFSDKQKRLQKEHRDVVRAEVAHYQCRVKLEQLQSAKVSMEEELAQMGNVEVQRAEIMERKEALLQSQDGPDAHRLIKLGEETAEARAQLREVKEASVAGRQACHLLEDMQDDLQRASGYGMWDLLGGGLIATALKHSELNSASGSGEDAQEALYRFQRELADIQIDEVPDVELGTFHSIGDYLLDGLVFNWIVQSKINGSIEFVGDVLGQVRAIQDRLRDRESQLEVRIADSVRQATSIVEGA